MQKKTALLIALIMLLVTACSQRVAPQPPVLTQDPLMPTRPGPTPEPLAGPELALDQKMLISHTTWTTLEAEANIITQFAGAPAEVQTVQVWIEQPARFRVQANATPSLAGRLTVSDGQNMREQGGETYSVPPDMLRPFVPPSGPSDTVSLHPLGSSLGTPLSDLLFPVGLAQRVGEYRLIGKETLLGRTVSLVEWSYLGGQANDRLWVDDLTGVVLRQQSFGKQGSAVPEMEIVFTRISFDQPIAAEMFVLP